MPLSLFVFLAMVSVYVFVFLAMESVYAFVSLSHYGMCMSLSVSAMVCVYVCLSFSL